MQNDMLQRNDYFLKSVANSCRILVGWKNRYDNKDKWFTEANDGMAFTTTSSEEKQVNKKNEITCFKSKKVDHYSNECDEEDTVN